MNGKRSLLLSAESDLPSGLALPCFAKGTVEKVVLECKSLLLRFLSWFGNWISRTNSVREFQFPHEQDGFSTRPKGANHLVLTAVSTK